MNDKLDWIEAELSAIAEAGLLRRQRICSQTGNPTELSLEGKNYINFSNNDYLGLAAEIARMPEHATGFSQNWGSGSSPLIAGRGEAHHHLEQALADFKASEAAILFSTGYAANVGAITAVTGADDIIFSDARNHASIIDGCRLSQAKVVVYRHNDAGHLSALCGQASGYRRRLIVTDTLFSMDGDIAPLTSLVEVSARYDAILMVDEAHATGVFGSDGRGLAQELGCEEGIDISVGTLSKALGSIGGFVTGRQSLIDLLVNKARPYIYSTAMPSACARAGSLALQRLRAEPQRREKLLNNVEFLTSRLIQKSILPRQDYTQIVPMVFGDPEGAVAKSKELLKAGFYIPAIRPPTVPKGESLLRISLSCMHTREQLQSLVDALIQ